MQQMITPDEARQIVLEQTHVLEAESVAHANALGRVLAADVWSDQELPPFDNSAMDGYAVVAEELQNASQETPTTLRLAEIIGAGEVATRKVERGTCVKIMTGAPVPEGATAVVMREETEAQGDRVLFFVPARSGQCIRPRGDDIKIGERVLAAGTLVRPAEWAMLAGLGKSEVQAFRAPQVGVIATGEELVDVGAELKPGQIRDSNSFALGGLCKQVGARVQRTRVGDSVSGLREKLIEYAASCDCIITSGGVSAGDFDPVRDALLEMQAAGLATIHFWKIAMKPGKPVMFATLLPSSQVASPTAVFGLPGNPVSVMVSFEQFVRPALWKMQGRDAVARVEVRARVLAPFNSPKGKMEFVRASVYQSKGEWQADVTGDQSSGRLSTMTRANSLLLVPAEATRIEAGQYLQAQLTDF